MMHPTLPDKKTELLEAGALYAGEYLSIDEGAALAGLTPESFVAALEDPETLGQLEGHLARTKVSGKATEIKALALLDRIMDKFMEQRPQLLGALCELLAAGMAGFSRDTHTHNHRLYDFVALGEAICQAAEVESGTFIKQMNELRASTGAEIASGDEFIIATRKTLGTLVGKAIPGETLPGYKSWFSDGAVAVRQASGRVIVGIRGKALFDLSARSYPVGSIRGDWVPRSEREVSGALLRTTPIFSDIGIQVVKREPSKGHPYWEFVLPEAQCNG